MHYKFDKELKEKLWQKKHGAKAIKLWPAPKIKNYQEKTLRKV